MNWRVRGMTLEEVNLDLRLSRQGPLPCHGRLSRVTWDRENTALRVASNEIHSGSTSRFLKAIRIISHRQRLLSNSKPTLSWGPTCLDRCKHSSYVFAACLHSSRKNSQRVLQTATCESQQRTFHLPCFAWLNGRCSNIQKMHHDIITIYDVFQAVPELGARCRRQMQQMLMDWACFRVFKAVTTCRWPMPLICAQNIWAPCRGSLGWKLRDQTLHRRDSFVPNESEWLVLDGRFSWNSDYSATGLPFGSAGTFASHDSFAREWCRSGPWKIAQLYTNDFWGRTLVERLTFFTM